MNAAYGKGNDVMESCAQGQIWTHASIWVHTLLANPNLLKPSKYDGRIKDYSVWAQCMRSNPHIWVKGKMSLRWKCINRRSLITKASQQAGSGYRGLATKAPIQRAKRKSQGVNETKKKDFHLIRMRWKAGGFACSTLPLARTGIPLYWLLLSLPVLRHLRHHHQHFLLLCTAGGSSGSASRQLLPHLKRLILISLLHTWHLPKRTLYLPKMTWCLPGKPC